MFVLIMAVTTVAVKKVHQRTRQQQQVGSQTESVRPVFPQEEEGHDHTEGCHEQCPFAFPLHIRTPLNLSAFPITLTEDSAIAAAAMIGDRRSPKAG
jgi:hypothetical protein